MAEDLSTDSSFTSFSLQAYFRQGVALQYLGRHADALAAFASGLAQDPKSLQLLVGMVEAAMKSPLRGEKCGRWTRALCARVSAGLRVCVSLFFCFTLFTFLSYSSLKACLGDNPRSVNKCVEVTLPVSFVPVLWAGHLSICPSSCLCERLVVSSTYLRILRNDACSFSISYCQSGWHTLIACYLNEHPALMPLSVSAPV